MEQVKDLQKQSQFTPTPNVKALLVNLAAKGFECPVIMDVGAHLSNWSREAKIVFKDSAFYLIEPLNEMEQHLKQFCVENINSKYFLSGVGSINETAHLVLYENNLAGAYIIKKKLPNLQQKFVQRELQITTIDSLIDNNNLQIPDLVKLDVQGFELEALKGASKMFGKTEVFILEACLYEISPDAPLFSDVIIFMKERGYELYDLTGFFRREKDLALMAVDLCFVKNKGFFRS